VPGFVRERFLRRSRQLLPHEPVQQVDRLDRADHHLDMRDPVYLLAPNRSDWTAVAHSGWHVVKI